MALHATFGVLDYIVLAITIGISVGIGIYFGFVKKQKTTEEYLYGNRQMHLLPVAMSLAVTFTSAVSCLGVPAEFYTYGIMAIASQIGGVITTIIKALVIVPLLYPLRLNSAYEGQGTHSNGPLWMETTSIPYLGRRFNSRAVQLLGTYIGMLQTLMYMSVVLFAPALALEAVVGIPLWLSIIVVGAAGTLYTSVGGFKSVIWTDVFQFVIMYGGLTIILILGGKEIGSFGKIFDLAKEGNRMAFIGDVDPRVRHSLLACALGTAFMNLSISVNQSAVQRISSMKSKRDATISVFLNIPISLFFAAIVFLAALVAYAYFAKLQCDPIEAGYISSPNQLMPYYVIVVFNGVPALAGLFIAALFSASLSSLSSGISALATNTLQDILVNHVKKLSQIQQTLLAKLIVMVYGGLSIGFAYAMKSFSGPVTQIASTAFGACGGPYVGMFFLGAIFPQANWIGAFVGGILSIAFNVWLALGAMFWGTPSPRAPPITTSGCVDASAVLMNESTVYPASQSPLYSDHSTASYLQVTESTKSDHLALYDLSYLYFGLVGVLMSMVIGLIVSLIVNRCTGFNKDNQTDAIYIIPFLRGLWSSKHYSIDTSYSVSNTFIDGMKISTDVNIGDSNYIKCLDYKYV